MSSKTLLLGAAVCLVASQAFATVITPGSSSSSISVLPAGFPTGTSTTGSCATFPVPCSTSGSDPLLHEGFSWGTTSGNKIATQAAGIFETGVWVDPVTHDLDFFYQIQNNFTGSATASDTISTTFTLADFGGFTTDVYQADFGSPAGAAFFTESGFLRPTSDQITTVSRSANGEDVNVTLSTTGITPKTNSAILVIKTNAKDFDQTGVGSFSWKGAPSAGAAGSANTKNFTLDALEPLLTPEPGFYGLLSLGIAGLLLVVRRRAEKAKVAPQDAASV